MNNLYEEYSKLLSSKNLSLIYDAAATTASYNLESRVITLPVYEFLGKLENQLLTSHEVGHALFSKYDLDDFKKYLEEFGSLFNIIEDIYIESSIKKEFPGLTSIFSKAYSNLNDKDFFSIKNINVSELSFYDRLNIHFKIGHCVKVNFSQEEMPYVMRCYNLKSNDDVVQLCYDLEQFKEEQKQDMKEDQNSKGSGSGSGSGQKKEIPNFGADSNGEQNDTEESDSDESKSSDECFTYDSFEKKLQRAVSQNLDSLRKNTVTDDYYLWFDTNINTRENPLDTYCKDITAELNDTYTKLMNVAASSKALQDALVEPNADIESIRRISNDGNAYFQTMKNAKRMRNIKKRLTGNIDFRRLPHYKTSENIFKHRQLKEKEQNHAVTILIDYSGSMRSIINQVLIQALLTCEFCKKNNIYFDAYIFGAESKDITAKYYPVHKIADSNHYNLEAIYTILSNYYDEGIRRAIVNHVPFKSELVKNHGYDCTTTPLIPAVFTLWHSVANQKRMGYDKTHAIVISDGDNASDFNFNCTITSADKASKNTLYSIINDPNRGISYALGYSYDKNPSYVYVNGMKYDTIPHTSGANCVINAILHNVKDCFGTNITYSYLNNCGSYFGTYGSHFVKERVYRKSVDLDYNKNHIEVLEPDEGSFADSFIFWNYNVSGENFNDPNTKKKYATTTRKVNKFLKKKVELEKIQSIFITELAKNIA